MIALSTEIREVTKKKLDKGALKTEISHQIQACLWGNRADLSLSGGDPHFISTTLFNELEELRGHILVDHIDIISEYLAGFLESCIQMLYVFLDWMVRNPWL